MYMGIPSRYIRTYVRYICFLSAHGIFSINCYNYIYYNNYSKCDIRMITSEYTVYIHVNVVIDPGDTLLISCVLLKKYVPYPVLYNYIYTLLQTYDAHSICG